MAPKWKYYFWYISEINLALHLMLVVTRVDNCISILLNLPLKHFARLAFFLSIMHVSVYNIHVCMYRHTYMDDYSSLNIVLNVVTGKNNECLYPSNTVMMSGGEREALGRNRKHYFHQIQSWFNFKLQS